MPRKKRFTKGTAKTEASRVSKLGRQQIPSAIRSAATVLSKISGNSLLSIGKSLEVSLKRYLQLASNDRSQSSQLHDFEALVS